MYGNFDPIIVFGWKENNREHMIHQEWLYKHYGELDVFTSDVVRNYAGNIIYGVRCSFGIDGRIELTQDKKQYVIDAHRTITERFGANTEETKNQYTGVGCYLALFGGYEMCHKCYIPGIGVVPYHYSVNDDEQESDTEYEVSDEKNEVKTESRRSHDRDNYFSPDYNDYSDGYSSDDSSLGSTPNYY